MPSSLLSYFVCEIMQTNDSQSVVEQFICLIRAAVYTFSSEKKGFNSVKMDVA